MSRSVLAIGGIVLAGAVIALVLIVGTSSHDASTGSANTQTGTSTTTTTSGGGGGDTRPALANGEPAGSTATATGGSTGQGSPITGPPPLDPNAPTVTPRDQPRGTATGSSAAGSATGGTTGPAQDYVVGDTRVRDHRGGEQTPMDIPPNVHPPEGPRIDSTLTNAIGQKVKQVMFACAKDTSRDGRGTKPRVDGQLVIAVKANQLAVLTAQMEPRDVAAAVATTIKTCMEPKLVGATVAAPDQADLDSYSINFSLTLP